MFSRRSGFDPATNALTLALERARRTGRPVLDLTVSNPTTAGIPYAREEILGALADPRSLVYEPAPFGLPPARAAVAADLAGLGYAVDPSSVVLTASTSEAYSFLLKLLCDPGDEVLVPRPSYPLLEHLAAFESVRLVPYRLAYDGAWYVDLDSLRAAVSPQTRAVLVVSPNNPTGSFLKRSELEAMLALGLPIVCDEVFARYGMADGPAPDRVTSVLQAQEGLVFSLGGLSKLAALPQMKVGWLIAGGAATNVRAALDRLELICDSFLSVGAPVQHALPALLACRTVAERAILTRVRTSYAWLTKAVRPSSPASVLNVEGGWYATIRVPRTQPEEAWVLDMLEQDGVYVHPGHFFDFEHEAYVVVSLLTPEDTFRQGIERILQRVELAC